MSHSDFQNPKTIELDPEFQAAVQRLHELTVYGRWAVLIGLWLTIGSLSLWGMRDAIGLMQAYFTWAALRHGLIGNPLSTVGLGLCIGLTLGVLIWQSRNILFGLPEADRQRLEKMVLRIRQQGKSHPLWNWIEPSKK
jgi:hypothetical protein